MTKKKVDVSQLAAELVRWRGEANMTQIELALAVGKTQNYIQKIEGKGGKEIRRPAMDTLAMIVATLDKARYENGYTDFEQRLNMNYAFSLAGYPTIALDNVWAFVLQDIAKIPTIQLRTQEEVNKAALEIVERYKEIGGIGHGAATPKQSVDSGDTQADSEATRKAGDQEETQRPTAKRPPHGSR